jgi:hypothetical protein
LLERQAVHPAPDAVEKRPDQKRAGPSARTSELARKVAAQSYAATFCVDAW